MNIFHLPSTPHWDGAIERIFGRLGRWVSVSFTNWYARLPTWKGKR
jgi:hypothetical protein